MNISRARTDNQSRRQSPDVSVVMGVFNGGQRLRATLESVLGQQGCDFEFIVVDDGSTDASRDLLDRCRAKDSRLRVIHQENAGLTQALVRGCADARGEFIARQDCGDVSLPGRLRRQVEILRGHPGAVMTAGAVRTVGPAREFLFDVACDGKSLHDGLDPAASAPVAGPPHHGATMFLRSAYEAAGGYRPFFTVAQDIDLWLRLRELGLCLGDVQVGYEAQLDIASISAVRREEQLRYAAIAQACARHRASGLQEDDLLIEPRGRRPQPRTSPGLTRARFLYFVGRCLAQRDPGTARRYYLRALREYPFHFKSLARLLCP
ncbi:MAG: glycosyltransferase family A protein [Pseudomonadota bacterium]